MILDPFIKWFSFAGAVVAVVLGILKIVEKLKDKPILHIETENGFFNYINEKTRVSASLGLTNKGRRPITIKNIGIDILDDAKRKLSVSVPSIPIILPPKTKRKLEPSDYATMPIRCVL